MFQSPTQCSAASESPIPPVVAQEAACKLPTPWAEFDLHVFLERPSGKEHLALVLGRPNPQRYVLTRIHSECMTGDALFSMRCDCGAQLEAAMRAIAERGEGIVLYLRQEGRGIGLANKIRAYAYQDEGDDTVEANCRLGFSADLRRYDASFPMLCHFGIRKIDLLTNNPRKVDAIASAGFEVRQHALIAGANPHNAKYLSTKAIKLGHLIPTIQSHPLFRSR